MQNQLTLDTTTPTYPPECRYCIHWQPLPLNQQKEGWGVNGYCNSPRCLCDTSPSWTRCEDHTPITDKPSWTDEVRALPNRGIGIYIKQELLDVEVDIQEHVIRNKHGVVIERY